MEAQEARNRPEENPGVATAEQGTVLLDGPDGVAIAMTPEAAIVTGQRLIAAGKEARHQEDDATPHGGG